MHKNKLHKLLLKNQNFCNKDGILLKNNIVESALSLDPALISLLNSEDEIREHFFVNVDDILVFDKIKFQNYVTNKEFLPNSYTKFANHIGLTVNEEFLSANQKVVIDFPYKDCILEGGQTSDDKKNKRDEVFWNQTLAPNDIDRLFEPKAFTNWKKFDINGEHKVDDVSMQDNLIIKGNNLICLESLVEIYREKIKMIYIDPPYNSGGGEDIFTYNNTFNHATWLTFMKNRLIAAKKLLSEDGFISIAIDNHEVGYLIVLADEIFGRDNRINVVTVAHNPQGRNQEKFFGTSTEFMLVYAKNKEFANFNQVALDPKKAKEFDKIDSNGKKYRVVSYIRIEDGPERTQQKIERGLHYPIYISHDMRDISLEPQKGYIPVYPLKNKEKKVWKKESKTFLEDYKKGLIVIEKDKDKNFTVNEKRYEKEVIKTHWVDAKYSARVHGTQRLNKILGKNSVSFPKSIHTVLDTLKLMTKENDIVLDFFAGSGTTGEAVTILNKLDGGNRRFILVEQLDAHLSECIKRNLHALKENNIDSSFVYFELAQWNAIIKNEILQCNNTEELIIKFDDLSENYQLRYNLDIKQFKNALTNSKTNSEILEFSELSFEDQKRLLIEMIDINHLYINYPDMDDENFNLSKADKGLNRKFYKESK